MNLRPSGYEPDELPDCSTPHQYAFPCFGRALHQGPRILGCGPAVYNRLQLSPKARLPHGWHSAPRSQQTKVAARVAL